MRKDQNGSHLVGIILFVAVLGVVGFVGMRVLSKHNNSKASGPDGLGASGQIAKDCKSSGTVKMQHMPMDLSDVGSIVPAGTLAGAHVTPIDHLYFYPKDMKHRDAAPVYAMADGFIVDYSERTQSVDTGATKQGEFRLFIQHTCDFYSYFDLMTSLDDSIAAKLKGGDRHLAIKAGQVLGRVGAQSLDTAIYNYAMVLPGFIHPDLYKGEDWKVHTDDFFAYFDEPMLAQMLALNTRKVKPYGGKIDYDVAGKLRGNWFLQGTNGYAGPKEDQAGQNGDGKGYWSGHFSIAPDAVKPEQLNISFGDYQGKATQFTALIPSPDPATVGVSDGIVKYELTSYAISGFSEIGSGPQRNLSVVGTVLLQVLDGEKLKMEAFPSKTAAQVASFTSAVKTYER